MVTIRDFAAGDESDFYRLNEEWITRYFVLEAEDIKSLRQSQEVILDPGGRIFLACAEDGEPIGCCALKVMGPREFEVVKMAVTGRYQGKGIGRMLLAHAISESEQMGATRLYLETSWKLPPAIRLYESMGFEHLPPERITPSPYVRAEVYMERRIVPATH